MTTPRHNAHLFKAIADGYRVERDDPTVDDDGAPVGEPLGLPLHHQRRRQSATRLFLHLDHIERRNPEVNAIVSLQPRDALLREAAERDAMLERLGLTPRQREVLTLLLDGKSNKTIARDLAISVETVKDHVAAVLRTLGVNSRTQAVAVVSRMPLASGSAAAPRRALLR